VTLRNQGKDFPWRVGSRRNPVAGEGGLPTIVKKHLAISTRKTQIGEKHVLVIPFEKNHFLFSLALPLDKIGDYPLGSRTSIHIVPQKDKPIRRLHREGLEETSQLIQATMNVPNDVALHRTLYPKLV
jgi:hypothetical protein